MNGYAKSTRRLSRRYRATRQMAMPWIMGKSRWRMAVIKSVPIPGQEKTLSMTMVPLSKAPSCKPMIVMMGTKAFFKT